MKRLIRIALLCALLALVAAPAMAKTVYVNGNYTGSTADGEKDTPYKSIRAALAGIEDGDVIELLGDTPLLHSVNQASYADITKKITIRSAAGENYSILANADSTAARRKWNVKADLTLENVSITPSPNALFLSTSYDAPPNLTIKGGTSTFFSMSAFETATFDGAKVTCTSASTSIRAMTELKLLNGSQIEAAIQATKLTASGAASTFTPVATSSGAPVASHIVSELAIATPIQLRFKITEGEAVEEALYSTPVLFGMVPSGSDTSIENLFQIQHTSPRGEYALELDGSSLYLTFKYPLADYTAVDAAIAQAAALNPESYVNFDIVETAIAAVVRGKQLPEQAEVDAMAQAIEDALAALIALPTGDSSQPALWLACMALSIALMTGLYRRKRA